MINVATLRTKCANSRKMDCVDIKTHKKNCLKCEYHYSPMDLTEMMDALPELLIELKELRTLNQPQIDKIVHGQEVEVPKLSDEEVDELLSTVNPNEITADCDECRARIRNEVIDELEESIITKIKEWYWDKEMQEYHPDCDLFVNYFIVTVKDIAKQLKEQKNDNNGIN